MAASGLYASGRNSLSTWPLAQGTKPSGEKVGIEHRHLSLEYDLGSGKASLYHLNNKQPLLLNATVAAVFPRGMALASDPNYTRRRRPTASSEPGIEGDQLIIACTDTGKNLGLESRITLLNDRPGAVFEVVLTNASKKEIVVRHAEP